MTSSFTHYWEQRKLDDLCSLVTKQTGFDYSSTIKPALVNEHLEGTLPFIQNKDFSGSEINMDTDFYIPEEIVKKFPKITLDQPCLLISISGKIGNVGLYKRSERAFIGGAVGICRLLDDTNGEFIMQELLSDKGQHYFQSLIKASSHQNITVEDIRKIEIPIPSASGQEKISNFFENLDNLITLHQRKPLTNSYYINPWEQRKVGDTCKINGRIGFRGYTEKDIISKEAGGVLTFSPTNIVDNKLTMDCKNTYITREKYDESPEIMIRNGDILFVKTGSTLGKSALVTGLGEDASINPQIVVMRVEEGTETFFSNVLITQDVLKQVAAVRIGGAVPTMTETELKNFVYYEPTSKAEKTKIGEYFQNLDNLITLHRRMFISKKRRAYKCIKRQSHPLISDFVTTINNGLWYIRKVQYVLLR